VVNLRTGTDTKRGEARRGGLIRTDAFSVSQGRLRLSSL
jgi:hypothetical protein